MANSNDDFKKQFTNFWNQARRQAVSVAEEIRETAFRIRSRLDEEKLRQELNDLYQLVGRRVYEQFSKDPEAAPDELQELMKRIDDLNDSLRNQGEKFTEDNLDMQNPPPGNADDGESTKQE